MVPKIHKKGSSFRGTARYLLHDVDADTRHRVAWTETRNLATRNPEAAWRVMAATAMDQDRLKRQAGIPNTGRKSNHHVLHFTLSWHPEEAPRLNRQEMVRAANTILHVIKAQEHQCLMVSHDDQPQPHVHVIVNRVHPKDGRMLSSSFEKLKASRWAQKYEQERGKIYCEERVINNAARERGEYTRGERDKPKHLYDLLNQDAKDNERRKQILANHIKQALALKEAQRRQQARHVKAWADLELAYRKRIELIAEKTEQVIARNRAQIRALYRPQWQTLFHEHHAELREFEQREAGAIGRMKNLLRSIDFAGLVGRRHPEDGKVTTIAEAFNLIGNAGARLQVLKRQHAAQERALKARQSQDEQAAEQCRRTEQQNYLKQNRGLFQRERSDLLLIQHMEQAKIRAQWHHKARGLRSEWREIATSRQLQPERHRPSIEAVEKPQRRQNSPARDNRASITQPGDLLPMQGSERAARQIDQWKQLRPGRHDQALNHDHGEERER